MKILAIHNYYQQAGGEDIVFKSECDLLRQHGHEVFEFTDTNSRIPDSNPVSIALQAVWSWETYSKLSRFIQKTRPDIAHFHNTFPLISSSAYYACKEKNIPVVQTLHNYRLFCPAAILYREKHICEDCLGKSLPLPAIRYKCYHGSRSQTIILSASIFFHNLIQTFQIKVDGFIALTQFSRDKFISAGFPVDKLFIKPNFVTKIPNTIDSNREDFAIFVGRLTLEKGLITLLTAWEKIDMPLYIFGTGTLPEIKNKKNVKMMNFVDRNKIFSYMKRARMLIFPSEWYEGFPVSIAEAFASSLPVITSNIGSQAEIVKDGYSGLHFRSGDAEDLMDKVLNAFQNPVDLLRMGKNARIEYEEKYTSEKNYELLMNIYMKILGEKYEV